ncbi:MAG: ATP-dependent DNA helicase RecG [Lachnospiraceae bacterium]|nr:ATP-dependent DNA helicase RecG [Lachnospiraceae bacterium]
MKLTDSISEVKGIGEKTTALYRKLKINTIENLLEHYPRYYLTYEEPVDIAEVPIGQRVAIRATVNSYVEMKKMRTLTVSTFTAKDYTGSIKMVWFNSPFIKKVFHVGQTFIFVGTVTIRNYQKVMEHPEYYTEAKYLEKRKELQPVYSLTEGLTNQRLQKDMKAVGGVIHEMEEYLPLDIPKRYGLMEYREAVRQIHFPKDEQQLELARHRLVFDEFFLFLLSMRRLELHRAKIENHYPIHAGDACQSLIESLPYELTNAQKRTIDEIQQDMSGDSVMNRLVQGDVGSGKTIVAMLALLMTVESGYQGAFMAPTEVLATQHYENFQKQLEPYSVHVELLIGSTPVKEKRRIYQGLQDGSVDIVIGTHAIIQERIEYQKLALVITDEQHRFGVHQREQLANKGKEPHVLVMSATPIPRTLAIILYGDLDISIMNEMPASRLPIKNCVVGVESRPTAHHFIEKEVEKGHQAYVICPMVEGSESTEMENVVDYADNLRTNLSPYIQVEYLHGKMSAKEKSGIMERFYANEIQVLVSTTVIEVGIDNPNATVMMIENAERFGLAQLHQLRGRVGRGKEQSYCIMINTSDKEEAKERLDVLYQSNDGFHIANEDLRLRGPGDFFGVRQSGEMVFHLADIYSDADILKQAQSALQYLERENYDFEHIQHYKLSEKLDMALNL